MREVHLVQAGDYAKPHKDLMAALSLRVVQPLGHAVAVVVMLATAVQVQLSRLLSSNSDPHGLEVIFSRNAVRDTVVRTQT